MAVPLQMDDWAEAEAARGAVLCEYMRPAGKAKSKDRLELSTVELAFRIFAALRAHPHINNVLTHISRAQWSERSNAFLICHRSAMIFRHSRRTSSI